MAPHSLFRKFGHICEIHSAEREFTRTQSGNPIRRWFDRLRNISETNQRSYSFLRSQKKIMNEHRKLMDYPYIIHPFSTFRCTWEIICCIYIIFQTIMIPLDIAFYAITFEYNMVHSDTFKVIRSLTDILSFLDLIVNFFCGYCDLKENNIIVQPRRIAKRYLRRNFLLDLYSSIPFDVILNEYNTNPDQGLISDYVFFAHYLGIIKLLRYYLFVLYTARIFEGVMNEIYYVAHRISIAFITFTIYLHVICCLCIGWNAYQIAFNYKIADSPVIVKSYGSDIKTLGQMYIRFFYSACLVVFNAGYGFKCHEFPTVSFTTNIWLCSKLLYILIIAYFIQLQTAVHSSTQKYVDMLCEVKDYMQHRQIPIFLQNRIIAYYDIKFQNHFYQESEILNTVSVQLRQEIIMNTCRKLVEDVVFFKNLPLPLLIRIVSSLTYDVYLTNDVIAKVGTPGDCMYFICNGTVAVYSISGKELAHLHDGDHFGEIALIMKNDVRIASVIAVEVCELYRLDRNHFMRAIMPYPDLYEKIAFVATERKQTTNLADQMPTRREIEMETAMEERALSRRYVSVAASTRANLARYSQFSKFNLFSYRRTK